MHIDHTGIVVFTCAIGVDDDLRNDQFSPEPGVKFVAFTDRSRATVIWEQRDACTLFKSDRRNSRVPKILAHQFIDASYSIWMDARVAARVPLRPLIEEWLKEADVAVYRHAKRSCIYAEAEEVYKQGLDEPARILAQTKVYREVNFPPNAGLAECSIIARRHTDAVVRFNNAWWSEYCRHTVRDQISFPVVARQTGLKVHFVDSHSRIECFDFHPRGARRELAEISNTKSA